jgi:5-methylcytosine-specific restriction endonuclease McrA
VVRRIVYLRDGGRCKHCGVGADLEFDHIIPVAKGGGNTENNIELLCKSCNAKKSARIE